MYHGLDIEKNVIFELEKKFFIYGEIKKKVLFSTGVLNRKDSKII